MSDSLLVLVQHCLWVCCIMWILVMFRATTLVTEQLVGQTHFSEWRVKSGLL